MKKMPPNKSQGCGKTPGGIKGFKRWFMSYRIGLFALCLLALGATQKLCPIHKAPMTRKQVPIIFLVDRLNVEEWQVYTNARARLFPYSCDEIYTNAGNVFNSKEFQKHGWKNVPTNAWIYVCPTCDERKRQWLAEHPPHAHKPGFFP